MQAFGSDRFRVAGGKVILHSAISKGWQARVPKQGMHSEHPGTAVLWDEQYFEVVVAEPLQGGAVRYVLAPWQEQHTIRVFDHYDEASEARRIADHDAVLAQRKGSVAAMLFSVILGHLPTAVQNKLGNDYGISPARMTLISTIPGVVLFGICVWLQSGATLGEEVITAPGWLWLVAWAMTLDSGVRFYIAMSQNRPAGSLPGILAYILFWLVAPNRAKLVSPFARERGSALFTLPAPDDVALRDAIETRGPLFTLLTPAEQQRLAERFGYQYRRHAFGLAIIILSGSALGAVSSLVKVADSGSITALISLLVAGLLAVEQVIRLLALRRGPAGSVLGPLVRPFVLRYLQ